MDDYTKSNCPLMSDDVRAFYKAFIPARLKMESVDKNGSMSMGKYAKIEDIYNACIKPLGEFGIAIWHGSDFYDGLEVLVTRLIHAESGQWIQDRRVMYIERANNNQSRGSANTYARKLAVLSLCGLACEDNDCDSQAKDKCSGSVDKDNPACVNDPVISEARLANIVNLIEKTGSVVDVTQNILRFNKVSKLSDLKESQAKRVAEYIANILANKKQ